MRDLLVEANQAVGKEGRLVIDVTICEPPASAAELLALLSALSEVPLRQDLAITGSVNQNGDIQAIGGVNEKIEGFFDICRGRGLTGSQGVVIWNSANIEIAHLLGQDCQGRRRLDPFDILVHRVFDRHGTLQKILAHCLGLTMNRASRCIYLRTMFRAISLSFSIEPRLATTRHR